MPGAAHLLWSSFPDKWTALHLNREELYSCTKGVSNELQIIYPIQLLSNKSYTTYGTYTDCPVYSLSHTSFQGRQADSAADTVTKQ